MVYNPPRKGSHVKKTLARTTLEEDLKFLEGRRDARVRELELVKKTNPKDHAKIAFLEREVRRLDGQIDPEEKKRQIAERDQKKIDAMAKKYQKATRKPKAN